MVTMYDSITKEQQEEAVSTLQAYLAEKGYPSIEKSHSGKYVIPLFLDFNLLEFCLTELEKTISDLYAKSKNETEEGREEIKAHRKVMASIIVFANMIEQDLHAAYKADFNALSDKQDKVNAFCRGYEAFLEYFLPEHELVTRYSSRMVNEGEEYTLTFKCVDECVADSFIGKLFTSKETFTGMQFVSIARSSFARKNEYVNQLHRAISDISSEVRSPEELKLRLQQLLAS